MSILSIPCNEEDCDGNYQKKLIAPGEYELSCKKCKRTFDTKDKVR